MTDEKDANGKLSPLCGADHGDRHVAWLRHTADRPFDVKTSLPTLEPWHRTTILSIVDSDCIPARSMIGEVIEVGHYICHPAEARNKETGELEQTVRTVLPQSSGPPIDFSAKSIITAIAKLAWATGRQLPFDPPLKCKLRLSGTSSGRQVYKLTPVE
jgi:hypothetical protein